MAPNITNGERTVPQIPITSPCKTELNGSSQPASCKHDQEHLFRFWGTLNDSQRQELTESIKKIDFDLIKSYCQRLNLSAEDIRTELPDLQPLSADMCDDTERAPVETLARWRQSGIRELAENKVAVVLLAGGQGTRLGSSDPKGLYNVGLPSSKTLFRLQGERLAKLQQLVEAQTGRLCCIPWYVMTSAPLYKRTVAYFEAENYFGLNKNQVIFFSQNTLPCLSFDGKILLESPSRVAEAPDGNGGLYRALVTGGVLDDMEQRGICHVHVYCVDNVLVKMADPVFIGCCVESDVQCGAKVVRKTHAEEAVGVFGMVDGKCNVVEYSEITPEAAQQCNDDGTLVFDAANIANHYFRLDFLQKICAESFHLLPLHVARKKILTVDAEGAPLKPSSVNGVKIELFIFDAFSFAQRVKLLYVKRQDEFSALKNADGAAADTPTTCRENLINLCRRMVVAAGGSFKPDGEDVPCEVSPMVSYEGEGLEAMCRGKVFTKNNPALFL